MKPLDPSKPVVAIAIGSKTDLKEANACKAMLEQLGIQVVGPYILSAHRTPERMRRFALWARKNAVRCMVGIAGGSAHLPGMLAAYARVIPVLAVAVKSDTPGSTDAAEKSSTRMPPGCPVGYMGVAEGAGKNAGIHAAQWLGPQYPDVMAKLEAFMEQQEVQVVADDRALSKELGLEPNPVDEVPPEPGEDCS